MRKASPVNQAVAIFVLMLVVCMVCQVIVSSTSYEGIHKQYFVVLPKIMPTEDLTFTDTRPVTYRKPEVCENILQNLTVGKWQKLHGKNISTLDETYREYWGKKGILKNLWRKDGKCGYSNLQDKMPGSKWPAVGSWCDKDGSKPCCNNKQNGICFKPIKEACQCKGCVDMRQYLHAELSKWHPIDQRCKWRQYGPAEACDIIEQSQYDDIRFVGDSLMRNMFAAFMMLLTGDTVRGAWGKEMTERQKENCVDVRFFFWDECRKIVSSLSDVLFNEKLCGGKGPNFTTNSHVYYSLDQRKQFQDIVKSLSGKKGTLLLVGVGLHMQLNHKMVVDEYLDPAVQIRNDFYKNSKIPNEARWPRFIFLLPLLPGLLKPYSFIKTQNDDTLAQFSKRIKNYCGQHKIPVFDFRQFSENVHSFDGTHYGLGVNLMKNQLLLNYIAQESVENILP